MDGWMKTELGQGGRMRLVCVDLCVVGEGWMEKYEERDEE